MSDDILEQAEQVTPFWRKCPLAGPALSLGLGIWIGEYLPASPLLYVALAAVFLVSAAFCRGLNVRTSGLVMMIAVATLGIARYQMSLIEEADPISRRSVDGILCGQIAELPQVFQRQNRTVMVLSGCSFQAEDRDAGLELPYKVRLSIAANRENLWPMSSLKDTGAGSSLSGNGAIGYGDLIRGPVKLYALEGVQNPGGFNALEYYRARGIRRAAHCDSEDEVRITRAASPGVYAAIIDCIWSWRRNFERLLQDNCVADVVPIMKALILGDRTGITTDHYEQMQRIGVVHIIAISGLHVGFVALFFYWLFKQILLSAGLFGRGTTGLKLACYATMVPILFYVLVVSPIHATIRAAIIAILFLLGRSLDREREILNFLALAAIAILIWTPGALFEAGFQLSFAAAVAITIALQASFSKMPFWLNSATSALQARTKKRLRRIGVELPFSRRFGTTAVVHLRPRSLLQFILRPVGWILKLLMSSPVAVIGTAPIVAWWFGRISLIGLFANLYIVLIAFLLVPSLLLAAIASVVNEFTSIILLEFAEIMASLMKWLGGAFSSASISKKLAVSAPGIVAYAVLIAMGVVLWALFRRPARSRLILVAVAVGTGFVVFCLVAICFGSWSVSKPSLASCVTYYFVLISAASLIRHRTKSRAMLLLVAVLALSASLVIGSRWPSGLLRAGFLDMGNGFSCIIEAPDGKVLAIDGGGSSYGESNVGRSILLPYLRHRGINKIDYLLLSNPRGERTDGLLTLLSEAGSSELCSPEVGLVIYRGSDCENRAYKKFVSTIDFQELETLKIVGDSVFSPRTLSESALVTRLEYSEFSILFLSDAGDVSQALLTEYGGALQSTILVIPEGREQSIGSELLELVSPEVIIISGSIGSWRNPERSKPSLQLEFDEGRILRTKEKHFLVIESDGRGWRVLAPFEEMGAN
ncbi:MAG: ComEC/Rec2 family competence protein [Candidatus Coatesbacteria bacterium]|nr:ComEC/Rec2 family competence protein [Candidatus Coatesbacteria bacterium]